MPIIIEFLIILLFIFANNTIGLTFELQKYMYITIENKKIIISRVHNIKIEYAVDKLDL